MNTSTMIHGVTKLQLGPIHRQTGGPWVRDITIICADENNPRAGRESCEDITLFAKDRDMLLVVLGDDRV